MGGAILPKTKIDKELVIREAAHIANKIDIENLSLKTLAAQLGVKSSSLYNHVDGLDDLKQQIMLYGWKEMEDRIIQAVIGLTGYDAIRAMCYVPTSVIMDILPTGPLSSFTLTFPCIICIMLNHSCCTKSRV